MSVPVPHSTTSRLLRWLMPLAAGLLFALVLAAELGLRLRGSEGGYTQLIAQAFDVGPVRAYVWSFSLRILIPFYCFMGLLCWGLTLAWGAVWQRPWAGAWRPIEALGFGVSALLWAHLVLWWQVPSTLWVLPGVRVVPFWLVFPVLAALALAYPTRWLWKQGARRKLPAILAGWLALWSLVALLPNLIPRLLTPAKGGTDRAEVLLVGLDGLRADVGIEHTREWIGTAYRNAYTPIPTTRMLWHILWGGDPLYYTVGHAPPAKEEFGVGGDIPLPLLQKAMDDGWKPRFYIDDGGTIGLVGRTDAFDDVLMPARGWENFSSSNVAVSFPLYAAWENWARAFPTTNPWTPLAAGLEEALRQGRGSKWVMFHSCLAHQPIYLRRAELAQLPGWWASSPSDLEPLTSRRLVTPAIEEEWTDTHSPWSAYQLRMASILAAWQPIWNGLAEDPDYGDAVRMLFSDHGERFYQHRERVLLQGVHGYNLDPWETRVMVRVSGPAFGEAAGGEPDDATLSLLSVRDVVAQRMLGGTAITPELLTSAFPIAPMRYHSIGLQDFTDEPGQYRQIDFQRIVDSTYIVEDGLWFMEYDRPASERADVISIGWAQGAELWVLKPLVGGGAHRYHYDGYALESITTVSEPAYRAEKARVEQLMRPIAR